MNPQQQNCFCEGTNCNDIDKCICSGDGMTTYANKAKNEGLKSGATKGTGSSSIETPSDKEDTFSFTFNSPQLLEG